jgi:hypothetical protein
MLWCLRLIGVGIGRFDGINRNYWQREQLAGARDVVGALAAGEQAIVADAMAARSWLAMVCYGSPRYRFFQHKSVCSA